MTLDDYTSTYLTMTGLGNENTTYPNSRTGIVLPQTSIKFRLSENKTLYERKAYTFMILVGDIGGFTGAIIGLPAYFLNWYSSRMFGASIYEQLPINDSKKKKQKRYNLNSQNLQNKIAIGHQNGARLN